MRPAEKGVAMPRVLRLLSFVALGAAAVSWLIPAWVGTVETMRDLSQHMEYVWLVPVLSAVLLWQRRKEILASIGTPAPWKALPLLLLAAGFLFLGLRGGQTRFLQASAVLVLLALPLACCGGRTFRLVWFPLLLLAFVMPVGFLDNFTVPLRRASVAVTAVLLNGLGIGVRQIGTAIVATGTPPFQLDVADPCSGIRSLVALFAGTAAYGAFALHGVGRRWLLFLSSVPIAFLGNILRLLLTAVTCHLVSQNAGMVLHDNALFIVAPIYALSVFALADVLKRGDRPAVQGQLAEGKLPIFSAATAVTLLALAVGMGGFRVWAGRMPPLVFESDAFLSRTFAPLEGATLRLPWFCQNRACLWSQDFAEGEPVPQVCPRCKGKVRRVTRAELDILPDDTQTRKAIYAFGGGDEFTVSVVVAGRSRLSIHRPELCLPAQGFTMSARAVDEILPGLPMALFSLRREGRLETSGFAYAFLHSKGATVSNLRRVVGDSLERSLHNRIPRWAMITISSPRHDFRTPEGKEALRRFMATWYPTLRVDGGEKAGE